MTSTVKTTCPYCGVGCGLCVSDNYGTPEISPDLDHPANFGRICTKGAALSETLEHDDRLLYPEIRGRQSNWETALARVGNGFLQSMERYGPDSVAFYVSGQLLTEDYYVANKLMKGFIGSGNIDTNSRLCMSSAVAGHQRAFGEDIVPGCYEDLEIADLIVIVGGNSAWCHPVLFQRMLAAREQRIQTKLVVIDPRCTATAEMADLHLPLKPGSDVALFNGLFAFLERKGCADTDYIRSHTLDFNNTAAACEGFDIETVAETCDLPADDIQAFYSLFAEHERTATLFSQGVNQSSAGTDKVNAIINCHLLTGRIGRPGSGPFSLTGQPNAMGGREVGGLASTLAAHMDFDETGIHTLKDFWSSDRVAEKPGLKAVELFEAIADGRIKAVWIMGTNPVVSLPDADRVRQALSACELVVVSDCTRTDTTAYADVLLPAATWGEKDGTVTNSERRISRQRAFLSPPGEAKPDWWIITRVARRMGFAGAFAYEQPVEIFNEHARLSAFRNSGDRLFNIGGLSNLAADDYDALEPVQWPVMNKDKTGTARLLVSEEPAEETWRGRFIPVGFRPTANKPDKDYPFALNTGRIRDHWHTLTRTGKSPRLSAHTTEPCVAIHPADAASCGVIDGELAEVESRRGKVLVRVKVDAAQRPGEIFIPIHWNDHFSVRARVGTLINPDTDPVSGEPEFKFTPVRIRPWHAAWYGFVLTRSPARPGRGDGMDYWTRNHGRDHWRLEIAGREIIGHRAPWARRILNAVGDDIDWLEYSDPLAGCYRAAHLDQAGALYGCLMLAPKPGDLPPREWLAGLFTKSGLDEADRMALLAGRKPGNQAGGEILCSCTGIGRETILQAIRDEEMKTVESLGNRLGAGTVCGTCIPELNRMITTEQRKGTAAGIAEQDFPAGFV